MAEPFFGNFDLASLTLWLFYIFFALLIFYLQRENMREGYPMTDDDGKLAVNQGPFPVPDDKTFILPNGRGPKSVPSGQTPERSDIALKRVGPGNGYPLEPTGDPMMDGVGPASWAPREDVPELDWKGHPKIIPMRNTDFVHAAGFDPRGMPVISGDKEEVGTVTDMWVDEPEQLVRYLEFTRSDDHGGGSRIVPITMARIWMGKVYVKSLYAHNFAGIPATASDAQVTKLEEDKISGYYAGGNLYASAKRQEPLL